MGRNSEELFRPFVFLTRDPTTVSRATRVANVRGVSAAPSLLESTPCEFS
jgi:hypothetical protein